MMMEIVSTFGPLKAFHFKVNEDLNQPCAFLEYADQSITLKACAGLNGVKLGGRVLTVAQAVPHISSEEDSGRMPFYGIPDHVKPLLESPTQVLKLNNVLDQRAIGLLSQTDLEEIIEDVRLECSRFGSVVSINVVKPGNIQAAVSESKEVANDTKLPRSGEERDPESHHLDLKSMEGYLNHYGGERGAEQSSKLEEHEADGAKEGGDHDFCPTDVEAAGTSSVEDVKEADKIVPENCDDGAANHPEVGTMTDSTTVEDKRKTEGSGEEGEEVHTKESDLGPSQKMGPDNSDDGEIQSIDDMPEFEKTHHKLAEVVLVARESGTSNLEETENGVKNESFHEVGTLFEVGCVLVEFRRPEASCMAAHCLHGRVFDDRVVTVEYVPLDAYRAIFPK